MKVIAELGLDPAPFISLADRPFSLFVDPRTHNVLIDQGPGKDRINGAVLFASKRPRFALRDKSLLTVAYAGLDIELGRVSGDPTAAEAWIQRANRFLAAKPGDHGALTMSAKKEKPIRTRPSRSRMEAKRAKESSRRTRAN